MNVHFSSKTPEWATPQYLFDALNAEFRFTLDPCATKKNAKCKKFFTAKEDGLKQSWKGESVFMNPPYGREIGKWIEKAYMTVAGEPSESIVVCLLPARTDTKWFHDHIYDRDSVAIRFLKGRLRFGGSKHSAPFPSMVVVFEG